MSDKPEKIKFSEDDCEVFLVQLETQTPGSVSKTPMFGMPGVVKRLEGSVLLPADELRGVTVKHVPTGITVSVDKFQPHRNKQLAMAQLKKEVEAFIKERGLND
jgi:hypothetical protein